jgi:hypothetical protein
VPKSVTLVGNQAVLTVPPIRSMRRPRLSGAVRVCTVRA